MEQQITSQGSDYSYFIELFFDKYDIWNKLNQYDNLLILLPSDQGLERFAESLGLEVKQILLHKDFNEILTNHFIRNDTELSLSNRKVNFVIENKEYSSTRYLYTTDVVSAMFMMDVTYPKTKHKIKIIDEVLIFEDQLNKLKAEFPYLNPPNDSSKSFNLLDQTAIFNILVKLSPYEVIQSCNVNKRFVQVCKSETLFNALFKAHYPDYEIQNDSTVKTYRSILEDTYMYYYVQIGDTQYNQEIDKTEVFLSENELRTYLINRIWHAYRTVFQPDTDDYYNSPKQLPKLIHEEIISLGKEVVDILIDITDKIKQSVTEVDFNDEFFKISRPFKEEFIERIVETEFYSLRISVICKLVKSITGTKILNIYKGIELT